MLNGANSDAHGIASSADEIASAVTLSDVAVRSSSTDARSERLREQDPTRISERPANGDDRLWLTCDQKNSESASWRSAAASALHNFQQMGQEHENDNAAVVVVCAPSLSKMMGALHPAGALYARPVDFSQAKRAHAAFVELLRSRGIRPFDVRDILSSEADWNVGERCKLEDLAARSLKYTMAVGILPASAKGEFDAHYVSDAYKRSVLAEMHVSQLVDIILTNPTVSLTSTSVDTGVLAEYSFAPSTNIMFTRDQQVTTAKGVVMARLRAAQRHQEVDVLEFCLRKLGINVLGRVEQGYLEGGDFFPCGKDLCFIGVGPRSTYPAVHWMMENDMFGTENVIVVRDDLDKSQDRMHLDCVFNVVGDRVCIMLDAIIGDRGLNMHRLVDVWCSRPQASEQGMEDNTRFGRYARSKEQSDVEFSRFLRLSGFHIIPVTEEEQLEYGCNVLNIGSGRIISTEKNSSRRIATDPNFKGSVQYIDFSAVTAMYGGVHCASQVVCRERNT